MSEEELKLRAGVQILTSIIEDTKLFSPELEDPIVFLTRADLYDLLDKAKRNV